MNIRLPSQVAMRLYGLLLLVPFPLFLSGCHPADPGGMEPAPLFPVKGYTRMIEYPVDGVRLGQGWHDDQGEKAQATCIRFTTHTDLGQEQTMDIEVVSDRSELMESMDLSTEVQVKAIAYEVSGKASYAKEVEVNSESLNFVAHARVNNGVSFTVPVLVEEGEAMIALTPHYANMARRNYPEFERQCGETFVSAVYSGAELAAVLSFAETSNSKREQLQASMQGSGWGFEAKGSASQAMKSYSSNSRLKISFYQSGGNGNPIPTDQQGFVEAISRLPQLASEAGHNYRIMIQGYKSLANFPNELKDPEGNFRERLAVSYGRLLTIHEEITEILNDLDDQPWKWVFGPGMNPDSLRILQDEIKGKLRVQRELARRCAFVGSDVDQNDRSSTSVCVLPDDLDIQNDYAYRIQLPVLAQSVDLPVSDKQIRRCEQAQSDLLDRQREAMDGDPKNVIRLEAAVRAFRDYCLPATVLQNPELLVDSINPQIIDSRVRQVSEFRCDDDIDDPGCLTHEETDMLLASLNEKARQGSN